MADVAPERKDKRSSGNQRRRPGVLLVAVGTLLMTLSTGDVLAVAEPAEEARDGAHGTRTTRVISGTERGDLIYGLPDDDRILARRGADEVYGGSGRDLIFGGSGDDFIETKDGERDLIGCGTGYDVVSVDEQDLVSWDCEVVYRA